MPMLTLDSQKKRMVEMLYELPVVTENPTTTYVSLYAGSDFFDIDPLCSNPSARKELVKIFVEMIQELRGSLRFNKLAFVDKKGSGPVGVLVLAGTIGERTDLETVVVRTGITCKCAVCEKRKLRGASRRPLGVNDKVLLVTDVITYATTSSEVLSTIKSYGAKLVGIVAFLDREIKKEGRTIVEELMKNGIKVRTFMKRSELVYLGFDTPTADEILTRDYVSEISRYLVLSDAERVKLAKELDEVVAKALQNENPTTEMRKIFTNISLTLAIRTKRDVINTIAEQPA